MKTPVIKPPGGFSPALQRGFAWCPYCGEEKPFGLDSRLGYARCMGCGISERDFYVRQFNGLWSDDALDKFVRTVEKSRRKCDRPFPWETGTVAGEQSSLQVVIEPAGQVGSRCERCGNPIEAVSNRQRYCPECAKIVRREKGVKGHDRAVAALYELLSDRTVKVAGEGPRKEGAAGEDKDGSDR